MPQLQLDQKNHIYTLNGIVIPSVTEILRDAGFVNYDMTGPADFYLDRGKAVHLACEFLDNKNLDWDSVDPQILPYIRAYEKFKSDMGAVVASVERMVCNQTYNYAGTLDRIFILPDGKEVLADLKTGQAPAWTGLQLAAYNLCLPPSPRKRWGIELKENGKYSVVKFADQNDRRIFLAALLCYQWKKTV